MIEFGTVENWTPEGNFWLEICSSNKRDDFSADSKAISTTIYTDCWGAYCNLEKYGYKLMTVNHS